MASSCCMIIRKGFKLAGTLCKTVSVSVVFNSSLKCSVVQQSAPKSDNFD